MISPEQAARAIALWLVMANGSEMDRRDPIAKATELSEFILRENPPGPQVDSGSAFKGKPRKGGPRESDS